MPDQVNPGTGQERVRELATEATAEYERWRETGNGSLETIASALAHSVNLLLRHGAQPLPEDARPLAETLATGLQHPHATTPVTGLVAVDGDGRVVAPGSMVNTSGGARYTYRYATRATEDGGSLGKVVVSDGYDGETLQPHEFELFAHIFGLVVRPESVSPPAAGDQPHPWFTG